VAASYAEAEQTDSATQLIRTLLDNTGPVEEAVVASIRELMRLRQLGAASDIIEWARGSLHDRPAFLAAWARVISVGADARDASKFLETLKDGVGRFRQENLGIYVLLLILVGRGAETTTLLSGALKEALDKGLPHQELADIGEAFDRRDKLSEFEAKVRGSRGPETAARLLEDVVTRRLRRMRS